MMTLVCGCRGTVTISPSPVFTLFTNSSAQQYADAHLSAAQVKHQACYSKSQPTPGSTSQSTCSHHKKSPALIVLEHCQHLLATVLPASCVAVKPITLLRAFETSLLALALPPLTHHAVVHPQVPNKLQNWPLSQFQAHMLPPSPRRPRPANLFYKQEYYYWSGQPPSHFGHQPDRPPLGCFARPSGVTLKACEQYLHSLAKDWRRCCSSDQPEAVSGSGVPN